MNRRELFVITAATVLLLSHGRKKDVLTEGIQAPDFTADGLRLRQFRNHNRIIVVFGTPAPYLEDVAAHREQYTDRDLVVLAFSPTETPKVKDAPTFVHILRDTPDIAALYHADPEKTAFYLIGKDGHIALARSSIPSDEELFAEIDAMPMRRREMRERRPSVT